MFNPKHTTTGNRQFRTQSVDSPASKKQCFIEINKRPFYSPALFRHTVLIFLVGSDFNLIGPASTICMDDQLGRAFAIGENRDFPVIPIISLKIHSPPADSSWSSRLFNPILSLQLTFSCENRDFPTDTNQAHQSRRQSE